MKKRDTCVICGEKATCFYYYNDSYVPFCLEHYSMHTNFSSVKSEIKDKKDLDDYLWRR